MYNKIINLFFIIRVIAAHILDVSAAVSGVIIFNVHVWRRTSQIMKPGSASLAAQNHSFNDRTVFLTLLVLNNQTVNVMPGEFSFRVHSVFRLVPH